MGYSQLSVFVDIDLGLKYFCQIWLVDKAKIRDGRVLICKFTKNQNIVKNAA